MVGFAEDDEGHSEAEDSEDVAATEEEEDDGDNESEEQETVSAAEGELRNVDKTSGT